MRRFAERREKYRGRKESGPVVSLTDLLFEYRKQEDSVSSISSHENWFCTFPTYQVSPDARSVGAGVDTLNLLENGHTSEVEREVDRNRLRSYTETFFKDSCSDRDRWVVN